MEQKCFWGFIKEKEGIRDLDFQQFATWICINADSKREIVIMGPTCSNRMTSC
jgi:hypothetical protein